MVTAQPNNLNVSCRVSALQSVVAGLISSGGDYGIHSRWDRIRSKQLSSVLAYRTWMFGGFSMQLYVWSAFLLICCLSCVFCYLAAAFLLLLASKRTSRISVLSSSVAAAFLLLLTSKRSCRISSDSSCLAEVFLLVITSKRTSQISSLSSCLAAAFLFLLACNRACWTASVSSARFCFILLASEEELTIDDFSGMFYF